MVFLNESSGHKARIILLSSFILLLSGLIHAQAEIGADIIISNIKSPKGIFVISFYNKDADFPKVGKDLFTQRVPVNDTLPHHITIKVPAEGWYAIAMFQEQDGKPKIKQDAIGIPEEPYAFSNNIHPKVEAPKFASCKYYIGKGAQKTNGDKIDTTYDKREIVELFAHTALKSDKSIFRALYERLIKILWKKFGK